MIGLVSESLRNLLVAKMVPTTNVTLLSPAADSSLRNGINLFAYRLIPNAFLANRDFQPVHGRPGELAAPPLGLSVYYLMTSYATTHEVSGDAEAQSQLGEAMRVLYEDAIIPAEYLEDGLPPGALRITLQLVDQDEVSRVWTALELPFQLCAIYEVATVDLATVARRPAAPRVTGTSVSMAAGAERPRVTAMSPRSGPVGTTLEFTGEHLAGWTVTVTVGGQDVSPAGPVTADRFTVEVPPGLAAGRYAVEVDTGRLTSFQSEFEVTA
ncbi:Pvc16 family protein [Solwaraspora sp. WMMB762]|uniref:Pvc16 family protein n=1 Tax=Solwaraspora sp. WMMB762 TaxID=3404120 RepID=UPI003B93E608